MGGVVVTEEQVRDEILIGTWRIGVSQCLALGRYGYGLACTAQRGRVLLIKFAVVSCPIEITIVGVCVRSCPFSWDYQSSRLCLLGK